MRTYHKPILKLFLLLAAAVSALPAQSQSLRYNKPFNYVLASNDTLATTKDDTESSPIAAISKPANFFNEDLQLANAELSISKPVERKQLMGYLKQVTADDEVNYNQSRKKFLYGLANVFAKLKLYPLAMKCFLKTTQPSRRDVADSLQLIPNPGYLAINAIDDSLVAKQAALIKLPGHKKGKTGTPTTYNKIASTFDDGKKAAAYAMLFHVKQPVPGKRKIFVMSNTGHTFITLIKYNTDSTYSSFSFGFYPKKRNPLSATPLIPTTSSVFKNDEYHQWDEVLGKFISKKRFDKILALTRDYNKLEYHLSNNNCTDFGIDAANLAGINIDETSGKWPLGHGNNPAITGQSLIEGKFTDVETGKEGVFVNTVVKAEK